MTDTFFAEIRALVAAYQPLDLPPSESDLAAWYRALRGEKKQTLTYPRVVLFAGSHTGFDSAAAQAAVTAFGDESHPVNRLCAAIDTDLSVHDLALEEPVGAMTAEDCAQAVAYGMMMIDEVIDVIGIAAFGAGTAESAARLEAAVAAGGDPLVLVQEHGGREIAATFGAILAARLARVPVVLGGAGALAALAAVRALRDDAGAHCLISPGANGELAAAEGVDRLQQAVTCP